MSVFKLADDHPLTKAGLGCVHLVETAERGLRVGDLVFEFPFGRIVDTGMACRRDGIVPPGLDLMTVHNEATAVRAAASEQRREVEGWASAIRGRDGLGCRRTGDRSSRSHPIARRDWARDPPSSQVRNRLPAGRKADSNPRSRLLRRGLPGVAEGRSRNDPPGPV